MADRKPLTVILPTSVGDIVFQKTFRDVTPMEDHLYDRIINEKIVDTIEQLQDILGTDVYDDFGEMAEGVIGKARSFDNDGS